MTNLGPSCLSTAIWPEDLFLENLWGSEKIWGYLYKEVLLRKSLRVTHLSMWPASSLHSSLQHRDHFLSWWYAQVQTGETMETRTVALKAAFSSALAQMASVGQLAVRIARLLPNTHLLIDRECHMMDKVRERLTLELLTLIVGCWKAQMSKKDCRLLWHGVPQQMPPRSDGEVHALSGYHASSKTDGQDELSP